MSQINRFTTVEPKPATKLDRLTLVDVARRCGVSKAAVSQALNWSPERPTTLREETRLRIVQVAEEMGYRPSWRGRLLANRRTHMLGVLYMPPMGVVPRGIYETMTDELDRAVRARGYQLIFVRLPDDIALWRQTLADQRFDGCLVLGAAPHEAVQMLAAADFPSVLVNLPKETDLPHVLVDDFGGAVQVTQHLIDLGHRHIVYSPGGPEDVHYSNERRYAGYCHAMSEAGLTPLGRVDVKSPAFLDSVGKPGGPTALVTFQHRIAVAMLEVFWRRGLRVPQDVSVATFNNAFPVEHTIPPLTVVSIPSAEMGRRAAEMLLERIERPAEFEAKDVTLPETLVVRESTAPPPAAEQRQQRQPQD